MTTISITLGTGTNYVSFPAITPDSFDTIFTNSGIISNISSFQVFSPILGNFTDVDYSDQIKQGIGYKIETKAPSTITYDGSEYQLSFIDIKSKLMNGWNLIGGGYTPIIVPGWCTLWDPSAGNIITTIISPNKAYWINSNQCTESTFGEFGLFILGLSTSLIFLYVMLKKELKWI